MTNSKTDENQTLKQVLMDGEQFFIIENNDDLRPFFMSIVSDSNHWMFISSNGGLSAGRTNSEHALFPYYTDDKITEAAEITGSKSIFMVDTAGTQKLWEPFSIRQEGLYHTTRNLYKNVYGNKVMFEEINHDLNLKFRYQWNSSNRFGFVRKSEITNLGSEEITISLLDGIQNILPANVDSGLQNASSNLVDAYKRSELHSDSGIGIFALSAIIVDRAEPSESLKASIAWSIGIEKPTILLSSQQLSKFRQDGIVEGETDVKAEKGAYFIHDKIALEADQSKSWSIIADVSKTQSDVVALAETIVNTTDLPQVIDRDIQAGTSHLIELVGSADGLQLSADHLRDTRHYSNTLFNIMRGGIFDDSYMIMKWDFEQYVSKANKQSYRRNAAFFAQMEERFSIFQLQERLSTVQDPDFKRLCIEYLPLCFSRRHGDPSRPWNKFSINTQNEDGSKILDYQGNWRDIFQNWEALVMSYPAFVEGMIHKFLNASTFDGYNPYRVTKDGFDWESIEPDNPWSYIGYWGDHQIIYLLKLLELYNNHYPGALASSFEENIFVYANVPYKIKSFEEILQDSKETVDFDGALEKQLEYDRHQMGADGALIKNASGDIHHVNFIEKILATLLAKLSNFIPEAGIWMNTQRPEWNDANNALVGNGVSMVTLYYIRRFIVFMNDLLDTAKTSEVHISSELFSFYRSIASIMASSLEKLGTAVSDADRMSITAQLGEAASDYRWTIYRKTFSGSSDKLPLTSLKQFLADSLKLVEHSINANQRTDKLYHAYNLMTVENNKEISVSYLSEMLEGQVAVLSSGYLSPADALEVLHALKASKLFRPDQYSYILYPNKELPGFLSRNTVPSASVNGSELLTQMIKDGVRDIVEQDVKGAYHFNSNFKNANDLKDALDGLGDGSYAALADQDRDHVLQAFEEVFNHKAFTGRSGTFYGYEGLGSIYWHMVSKLQLAVQECCIQAIHEGADAATIGGLLDHYYEISAGIGVHKPPKLYGAFPTDPYSHTPGGKGAQQPGMTGQVKEDFLSRFGELGVFVRDGQISFNPSLLRQSEFLIEGSVYSYIDVHGEHKTIQLAAGTLGFTYCQVPVVYSIGDTSAITLSKGGQDQAKAEKLIISTSDSLEIFKRSGTIDKISIQIDRSILK